MKHILYPLILLIALTSCNKDYKIYDYHFDSSIQILDNNGADFAVGVPIRIKVGAKNFVDRDEKIKISYQSGNAKSYIYFDVDKDKEIEKIEQNSIFENAFSNGYFVVNYTPQNGGKQLISFTISNGEYKQIVSKEITVKTQADMNISPFDKLTLNINDTAAAEVIINTQKDADNFYNLRAEVIEGKDYNPTIEYEGKSITGAESVRILTGLANIVGKIKITQKKPCEKTFTKVRFILNDRYNNIVDQTYSFNFL